jgi:hypothetical protein
MLFQIMANYYTYLHHDLCHMAAYGQLFIRNVFPFVYKKKHTSRITTKGTTQEGKPRMKPSELSSSGKECLQLLKNMWAHAHSVKLVRHHIGYPQLKCPINCSQFSGSLVYRSRPHFQNSWWPNILTSIHKAWLCGWRHFRVNQEMQRKSPKFY